MTKIVDKAMWGIGPVFIVIAVFLIDMCALGYYLVVLPFNYPWVGSSITNKFMTVLNFMFTIYMVYCIHFHYYMAIKTPPGDMEAYRRPERPNSDEPDMRSMLLDMEEHSQFPKSCRKCQLPKPERAHHCSICNTCILKFDHHCPWIHNCVGHFNHRYFLLFMTYLVISALFFVIFSWKPFMISLDLTQNEWPYYYPRPLLAFSVILAIAMGLAIGALCVWHYYLIITAQTTVEFYNNYYDKDVCKREGESFVNMYDFGAKSNLKRFFNIGDQYPWHSVLWPIPIPPKGTGRIFEKSEEFYLLPEHRQRAFLLAQQESQEIEDIKDI